MGPDQGTPSHPYTWKEYCAGGYDGIVLYRDARADVRRGVRVIRKYDVREQPDVLPDRASLGDVNTAMEPSVLADPTLALDVAQRAQLAVACYARPFPDGDVMAALEVLTNV